MNRISKIGNNAMNSIRSKYQELTSNQKLIFCITVVAILCILTFILSNIRDNKNSQIIDYKGMNGEIYYLSGSKIDNDTYATIYSISNEMTGKFTNLGEYKMEKDNFENVYDYIVANEFKKNYSQKKLFELFKNVFQKIGKSSNINGDIFPNGIVKYNDDYYMIRYSYTKDEEVIDSYIGIYLDTLNNKYYIWYLE